MDTMTDEKIKHGGWLRIRAFSRQGVRGELVRQKLRKHNPLSERHREHPSRPGADKTTALLWITGGAIYSRRESTCSFFLRWKGGVARSEGT
ncbi:hypothetical protein V1478_004002 [Vespula squamosa]|uniref:Uncharacterized protein n=1 Tax=Vespula squamosa TaxID=30214 RepID=A0ABD2BNF8_VESSQ